MNVALSILFLISVFTMPWWFVVPFGIVLSALPYGGFVALLGGALLDSYVGVPIAALFNFEYLYTTVFLIVIVAMEVIAPRIAD